MKRPQTEIDFKIGTLFVDLWDWGIGARAYLPDRIANHGFSIDIQILCFELWIRFRRFNNRHKK